MDNSLTFSFSPKASLVWKINNFFHSSRERKSSYFTFRGVKCRMILDLNVSKRTDEDDFIVYIEMQGEHSGKLNDIVIKSSIKDQYGREYFSYSKIFDNFALDSRVSVWCVKRKSLLANYDVLINQPGEELTFCCEFRPLIEYTVIVIKQNKVTEEKCLSDEDRRSTSKGMSNKKNSSQPSESMATNNIQKSVSKAEASRTRNEDNELKERTNESFGTEDAASGIKSLTHFKRLSLDLGALLASGKGADIILKCAHRQFPVHRSILWSRCKEFAEKCLKENREGIIEVTDTDSFVLEKFLECVYTGNISNLTENSAEDMYIFGNKYKFEPVISPCAEFLVMKLNDDNVQSIFKLASLYEDIKSLKNIVHYIIDNRKFQKDDTWFNTTFESPDELLDVFRAIDLYGK